MDFLKALFENGALTWEQFVEASNAKGFKIANLASGDYVAKKKYEDEVTTLNGTITELNTQIKNRDKDIAGLRKQVEDGTTDSTTKLADLTTKLETLQKNYDTDKANYEAKLSKQAYEYAVNDFANGKKFTSKAAKRDFITEMIAANLKMKDKQLLGAEDFVTLYSKENSDAFVVEEELKAPTETPKPTFVQPTAPTPEQDTNPFNFNFAGVR